MQLVFAQMQRGIKLCRRRHRHVGRRHTERSFNDSFIRVYADVGHGDLAAERIRHLKTAGFGIDGRDEVRCHPDLRARRRLHGRL